MPCRLVRWISPLPWQVGQVCSKRTRPSQAGQSGSEPASMQEKHPYADVPRPPHLSQGPCSGSPQGSVTCRSGSSRVAGSASAEQQWKKVPLAAVTVLPRLLGLDGGFLQSLGLALGCG